MGLAGHCGFVDLFIISIMHFKIAKIKYNFKILKLNTLKKSYITNNSYIVHVVKNSYRYKTGSRENTATMTT